MPRQPNRLAARRAGSLERMSTQMLLPARRDAESQGAWYRRCAEQWLASCADADPEHRDEVVRLARRAGERAATSGSAPS